MNLRTQRATRLYGMIVLFGLLVAVYTMSNAGRFHVVDEVSLFAVTESLSLRGEVDTNVIAWTQWVNSPGEVLGAFGPGGEVYSKKGPAPAFLAVPWYGLLRLLGQSDVSVGLVQGTLLWNGFVTALTALLLWATANRLGYDDRTGAALGLLLGVGTIAWPYANQFFGEPLSALALLTCFWGMTGWLQTQRWSWALLAGIGAGLTLTTVTAHGLLVGALAAYGFVTPWLGQWWARRAGALVGRRVNLGEWLAGVAAFALPLLIAGGLLLWYNWARFGNPLDTGYHFDAGEGFTTPLWAGLWGLALSPYRGLFWFTPLFVASAAAWPTFLRHHRAAAVATAALSGILLITYSLWWMWWAGFAWGPRFLVPLAPFWVLWLAPWVAELTRPGGLLLGLWTRRRAAWPMLGWGAWLVLGLTPLSVLVQVGAVVVNFVNYEIQLRNLYPTDWENPLAFGPPAQAFTDFLRSPVIGQFDLIRSNLVVNTDLAWLWSDGNIQWLLVGVGGAVVLTLGGALTQWWWALAPVAARHGMRLPSVPVRLLTLLLPALLLMVWLGEVSRHPAYGAPMTGYRGILDEICRLADGDEAVVTVAPYAYQIPMNWMGVECDVPPAVYGYAPDSMTHAEAEEALRGLLEQHNRIWMVTGGLPPNDPENTVERWLAANAYKSNDVWYEDYRLLDYATVTQLRNAALTPLNVNMVGSGTSEITVVAGRVSSLSQPGRVLPVEIYYRLQDRNIADLRWFVQLLRPEGYPAALLDTAPDDGYVPFSALEPNVELVERAGLLLPDNLPPGRYELIAGLYNPTQEGAPRLRTADGSDHVRIGFVVVQ
jgi:hypothetical protein